MSNDNVIPFPKRDTPACSCPIGPDRRFIAQPGCPFHGNAAAPIQPRIA